MEPSGEQARLSHLSVMTPRKGTVLCVVLHELVSKLFPDKVSGAGSTFIAALSGGTDTGRFVLTTHLTV